MVLDWLHERKLSSAKLSELGLKEKERLHEESAYLLVTERTLADLLLGIKELFKQETAALLYHVFKAAGERKAKSLLADMREHQRAKIKKLGLTGNAIFSDAFAKSTVLKEALEQLEAEGYCREFAFDISHSDKSVKLLVKSPLSLRLKRLASEVGGELTDEEASAVSRGFVSGIISAIIGGDVDIKEAEVVDDAEMYTLPKKVYEELFAR